MSQKSWRTPIVNKAMNIYPFKRLLKVTNHSICTNKRAQNRMGNIMTSLDNLIDNLIIKMTDSTERIAVQC